MGKKTWSLAALAMGCSVAISGVCGLKTFAAPALNSRGNLAADEGKVVVYDTDLDYLDNELDSLENEIDDTIFDRSYIREVLRPRRNGLKSGGIIDYDNGKVVIDTTDLIHMADGIDRLENDYVSSAVSALGRIGTYLDGSGNIGHSETSDGDSVLYPCAQIKEGIRLSQDVRWLDDVTSITADNLTAGTAAWVDGECVIGNGADNERAYKKGKEDGEVGTGEDIFDLEYVYHKHWGKRSGAGTGCYKGYHTHSDSCYETIYCSGYVTNESRSEIEDHGCHTSYTVYGHCGKCNRDTSYSVHVSIKDGCSHSTDGTTHKYTEAVCNSPYNAWKLICGKKEGVSYDSVTMIIRRNGEVKTEAEDKVNTEAEDEAEGETEGAEEDETEGAEEDGAEDEAEGETEDEVEGETEGAAEDGAEDEAEGETGDAVEDEAEDEAEDGANNEEEEQNNEE